MNKIKLKNLLTVERHHTHGDFRIQFRTSELMYEQFLDSYSKQNSHSLDPVLGHAIRMILTKVSRLAKDPTFPDHWQDIQGYASLGEEQTKPSEEPKDQS